MISNATQAAKRECKTTRFATILSCILSEPLVFCYALLVPLFIRDLKASTFQISLLVTLHPLISLIAMYWSNFSSKLSHKLLKRVNIGHALSKLPWLLTPFVSSPWALIAIAATYKLFSSGSMPGWNEVMRIKLSSDIRHKTFAFGMAGAYAVALGLTLWLAPNFSAIWRWAFFFSALVGLLAIPFQAAIDMPKPSGGESKTKKEPLKNRLMQPWAKATKVLREDRAFRSLQTRIMLFGIAMMMAHPATAIYFVKTLSLSYFQISFLFAVCKGCGSLVSSQAWGRLMNRIPMDRFATITFVLFALFIALLPLGALSYIVLPLAYFLRGVTQSAVHLLWHLSGPYYSGPKESASYSSVNLMLLGLRGLFAPALGAALCLLISPLGTLGLSSLLCVSAARFGKRSSIKSKGVAENKLIT